MDFRNAYGERQLSLASSGYATADKEAITRFLDSMQAQGIRERRLCKYAGHFMQLRRMINKPLTQLTVDEVDALLIRVNTNKRWAPWTRHDYQLCLKKFFSFFDGNSTRSGRIRVITPSPKLLDEGTVLTDEDISQMEAAAHNLISRVVVRLLFESAARLGEFCSLRVGDVQARPPFLILALHGTKNKFADRKVPVNNPHAIALFQQYLNEHPLRENPSAPLWLNYKGQSLGERGVGKILNRLQRKSGIAKKVNPHWFRHSKITQLAKFLSPQLIKNYVGWSKDSDMMAVYDHTSMDAVKEALIKMSPESQEAKEQRLTEEVARVILSRQDIMVAIIDVLRQEGKINILKDLQ